MSTKAPSSYNHLPLLSCSAVLARQLCGEPEPVCHCHAAEWEWALEATIEMNQIHHCLQGRGAEQHSLTHLGGGGPRWVQHIQATLLYENCIDFIIAGFCWPKYHQPCQKRAVQCSWLFKLLGLVGACTTKTTYNSELGFLFFFFVFFLFFTQHNLKCYIVCNTWMNHLNENVKWTVWHHGVTSYQPFHSHAHTNVLPPQKHTHMCFHILRQILSVSKCFNRLVHTAEGPWLSPCLMWSTWAIYAAVKAVPMSGLCLGLKWEILPTSE